MDFNVNSQICLDEEGLVLLQETISSVKNALAKVYSLQRYIENQQGSKESHTVTNTLPAVGNVNEIQQPQERLNITESNIDSVHNLSADSVSISSSSSLGTRIRLKNDIYCSETQTLQNTLLPREKPIPSLLNLSWHFPEGNNKPVLVENSCQNVVSNTEHMEDLTSGDRLAGTSTTPMSDGYSSRQLSRPSLEITTNTNVPSLPNTTTKKKKEDGETFRVFFLSEKTPERFTEDQIKKSIKKLGLQCSGVKLRNKNMRNSGLIMFDDLESAERAVGKLIVQDIEVCIKPYVEPIKNKPIRNVKTENNSKINSSICDDQTNKERDSLFDETELFSLTGDNSENAHGEIEQNSEVNVPKNTKSDRFKPYDRRHNTTPPSHLSKENSSTRKSGDHLANDSGNVRQNSNAGRRNDTKSDTCKPHDRRHNTTPPSHLLKENSSTRKSGDHLANDSSKVEENSRADGPINTKSDTFKPYDRRHNTTPLSHFSKENATTRKSGDHLANDSGRVVQNSRADGPIDTKSDTFKPFDRRHNTTPQPYLSKGNATTRKSDDHLANYSDKVPQNRADGPINTKSDIFKPYDKKHNTTPRSNLSKEISSRSSCDYLANASGKVQQNRQVDGRKDTESDRPHITNKHQEFTKEYEQRNSYRPSGKEWNSCFNSFKNNSPTCRKSLGSNFHNDKFPVVSTSYPRYGDNYESPNSHNSRSPWGDSHFDSYSRRSSSGYNNRSYVENEYNQRKRRLTPEDTYRPNRSLNDCHRSQRSSRQSLNYSDTNQNTRYRTYDNYPESRNRCSSLPSSKRHKDDKW